MMLAATAQETRLMLIMLVSGGGRLLTLFELRMLMMLGQCAHDDEFGEVTQHVVCKSLLGHFYLSTSLAISNF